VKHGNDRLLHRTRKYVDAVLQISDARQRNPGSELKREIKGGVHLTHDDRSNIDAGISSQQSESELTVSHRNTTPPGLSIAAWIGIGKTRARTKAVEQFPKLGPVGVLKPRCTTIVAGNRLSMTASREGISGGLLETAVDMTLCLDNANALTRPQQHQQRIAALSEGE
jgi:hypothetical protein